MPTVNTLAGPILRALLALHDLGAYDSGNTDGWAFAVEEGELVEDAGELLSLVERVATVVELASTASPRTIGACTLAP